MGVITMADPASNRWLRGKLDAGFPHFRQGAITETVESGTLMSGWAGLKPMGPLPSSRLSRRLANTTG